MSLTLLVYECDMSFLAWFWRVEVCVPLERCGREVAPAAAGIYTGTGGSVLRWLRGLKMSEGCGLPSLACGKASRVASAVGDRRYQRSMLVCLMGCAAERVHPTVDVESSAAYDHDLVERNGCRSCVVDE